MADNSTYRGWLNKYGMEDVSEILSKNKYHFPKRVIQITILMLLWNTSDFLYISYLGELKKQVDNFNLIYLFDHFTNLIYLFDHFTNLIYYLTIFYQFF